MFIIIHQDELNHYGVKGMRWGVRKDKSSGGGSFGKATKTWLKITNPLLYAGSKRAVNNYKKGMSLLKGKAVEAKPKVMKKARQLENKRRNVMGSKRSKAMTKYRNKNIDGMSDADLRKAVNRMDLERQYRNLTKYDIKKGKKYVTSTYNTGKKIAKKAAKKAAVAG